MYTNAPKKEEKHLTDLFQFYKIVIVQKWSDLNELFEGYFLNFVQEGRMNRCFMPKKKKSDLHKFRR